ncbi:MAG: hypothetical protein KDB88_09275 [Flavobacteriales bacterium]|nr:hypothetical protein [Flavobacteriales bacterium]
MSDKLNMNAVLAQLQSADERLVKDALATIRTQGDARAIRPLIELYCSAEDEDVKRQITAMLYQVKVKGAVEELMGSLEDPRLTDSRALVLATLWNAGLDARDHLGEIITCALEGHSDVCFEALTVVEHQELWPDRAVRTAALRVEKALPLETDPYKRDLLNDLVGLLRERIGG